ncbi:hypothetical protein Shyd_57210 [Streptomyces hydrogenans]|uniref:Heme-binding protein n=1 Tax=Streptomyces hydrogenans TaxID=1873719 RepID=A0ABQ3PD05_9ACTN|nr:hypothetical protein GCM10018784_35860 [Streptomyces hydrogenans]GHI22682.1 hypothetical protein Shyd_40530 [Streptomyces hydrogenans]GHI22895.1 hypothetical protein Shyd_42660 [Streptomyces hydrogenans]GHI24350.1 hypothetical protein Shyd_57210 [Streptomyces hydrogenans]
MAAVAKADAKNDNTMRSTHLTIEAAADAAEKENQQISVAVVDRNGNTILAMRGDGVGPQSFESTVKKAYTAVSWNAPSSRLVKCLANVPTLKDIPGTLFLGGGASVTANSAPIAGFGGAGAPSTGLDEKSPGRRRRSGEVVRRGSPTDR